MKQTLLLLALLAIFSTRSQAQKTGSFTDTVLFNGGDRILSCYVPPAYDSTVKYQLMVCLHGMGDNSNNYRNALISSLNWKTVFPFTIFICPSGGSDANGDFSTPPGDEEIIKKY
jgi:poly(3-hydroxybutyrate) depolymerase